MASGDELRWAEDRIQEQLHTYMESEAKHPELPKVLLDPALLQALVLSKMLRALDRIDTSLENLQVLVDERFHPGR